MVTEAKKVELSDAKDIKILSTQAFVFLSLAFISRSQPIMAYTFLGVGTVWLLLFALFRFKVSRPVAEYRDGMLLLRNHFGRLDLRIPVSQIVEARIKRLLDTPVEAIFLMRDGKQITYSLTIMPIDTASQVAILVQEAVAQADAAPLKHDVDIGFRESGNQ